MKSYLLIAATLLFAMGLVMIFSTSSAEILDHDSGKSTHHALVRQLLYVLAGCGLAFCVTRFGYQRLMTYSPILLLFFSFLLILVLIPGIGRQVNGSKRWLNLLGFSFQPSEFVKYLIPIYVVHRMLALNMLEITFMEFFKIMGLASIPMVLILIEPNNGTAVVIGVTLVVLCLLTQIPVKFWVVPLMTVAVIGGLFALQLPYVTARLKVYLNPEFDLKGKGHQPYQAKIAAGSGQIWGKGPGNSLQKLSYLPEAQNDYIAAIYAEEFGFVGMVVLITLYMFIGFAGFVLANRAEDRGGCYIAGALTFLFCFQAFLNLGVVSGLLPSTGLNLPLFSQGGSSLMANICGLGTLLSVRTRKELTFA
jgi:cell division protein FtsW